MRISNGANNKTKQTKHLIFIYFRTSNAEEGGNKSWYYGKFSATDIDLMQ